MVKFLAGQLTHVVFWAALLLALSSTALSVLEPAYSPLLVLSVLFNVWALYQSERKGFVRAREMRRAYEPPRHFNRFQVLLITVLIMGQSVFGLFVLFT